MYRFWDTIIGPILEVLQPQTIVEIGSDLGHNTQNLLEFCQKNDARLHVIDPLPKYDVSSWQERYGERFVFHRALSLDAIPLLDGFDAVLIDGDHNWYTVFSELRLIAQRCKELSEPFPLVMLHDIGWPYARRDLYYDPQTIPDEHRKPYEQKGMRPDSTGLLEEGGLNPQLFNAASEGDPRNGVLTAVEDFMQQSEQQLELVKVPGLHGLGILVPLRLKEQNEELAEFLQTFRLPPTLARYVDAIEEARLETEIRHAEARKTLRAKNADLAEARRRLKAKNAEVAELRRQASKLICWMEELDAGISAMLGSRRWKIGHALGKVRRRALPNPHVPAPSDRLDETLKEFHAWQGSRKRSNNRPET
jgi:hypothetical protein